MSCGRAKFPKVLAESVHHRVAPAVNRRDQSVPTVGGFADHAGRRNISDSFCIREEGFLRSGLLRDGVSNTNHWSRFENDPTYFFMGQLGYNPLRRYGEAGQRHRRNVLGEVSVRIVWYNPLTRDRDADKRHRQNVLGESERKDRLVLLPKSSRPATTGVNCPSVLALYERLSIQHLNKRSRSTDQLVPRPNRETFSASLA